MTVCDETGAEPPPAGGELRVLLLDKAALTRSSLSRLLELEGTELRVEARGDLAELSSEQILSADVVLLNVKAMDVSNPAVQASLTQVTQRVPNAPILIISEFAGWAHELKALQSGVRGFLPVELSPRMLVAAIRLVAAGGIFLPPATLQSIADGPGIADGPASGAAGTGGQLTPRADCAARGA